MRTTVFFVLLLLCACQDRDSGPAPSPTPNISRESDTGETKVRIAVGNGAVAELRSGPGVPVVLPNGLTIYPAARVVRNTVVASEGTRRVLVEFETPDPIAKVMLFHRAQAQAAGVTLALDLDGRDAASIGGRTAEGGDFALTAHRDGQLTRVELSLDAPR